MERDCNVHPERSGYWVNGLLSYWMLLSYWIASLTQADDLRNNPITQ